MKTDIEIAQSTEMLPIDQVAKKAGIDENLLEYYGKVKAKIDIRPLRDAPRKAKLILVTRFPNSPGAKFSDLLLICGADEAPNQQGSVAVKLGQLFIIDVLFHEYCSKDAKTALENRERTLNATAPMLL